jgi:hypothetical protein
LCDDCDGNFIINWRAEHNNALLEQAREKVPGAFAARRSFDNGWDPD